MKLPNGTCEPSEGQGITGRARQGRVQGAVFQPIKCSMTCGRERVSVNWFAAGVFDRSPRRQRRRRGTGNDQDGPRALFISLLPVEFRHGFVQCQLLFGIVCDQPESVGHSPGFNEDRFVKSHRGCSAWNSACCRADSGPCVGGRGSEANRPQLVHQHKLAGTRQYYRSLFGWRSRLAPAYATPRRDRFAGTSRGGLSSRCRGRWKTKRRRLDSRR